MRDQQIRDNLAGAWVWKTLRFAAISTMWLAWADPWPAAEAELWIGAATVDVPPSQAVALLFFPVFAPRNGGADKMIGRMSSLPRGATR